ncbi:MAG TPA: biotin/lipoyl-binding protein [Phaeodactylibacter sp.]|nr:biotin/lipoyl-binding protein [Phaeodactylibacter sp.]
MKYFFQVNEDAENLRDPDSLQGLVDIVPLENGRFHILYKNQSFVGELLHADFANRILSLLINGNTYHIKALDEYDLLVKKLGLASASGQKVKDIKAPMPGLVLEVTTTEGMHIQKGESLLILEAMKMENVIKAPGDGVVKSIAIHKGQTVDKGDILIELE